MLPEIPIGVASVPGNAGAPRSEFSVGRPLAHIGWQHARVVFQLPSSSLEVSDPTPAASYPASAGSWLQLWLTGFAVTPKHVSPPRKLELRHSGIDVGVACTSSILGSSTSCQTEWLGSAGLLAGD